MLADRIGGAIAMLFGALAVSEAVRLYPSRESAYVGDHLMPGIVGGGLLLLGLVLVIRKGKPFKVQFPDRAALRNMAFVLAWLFAFWLMIPYAGYLPAAFIASAALFRLIGGYAYWKSVLFSALQIAAIYILFVFWLGMPFPTGLLGL